MKQLLLIGGLMGFVMGLLLSWGEESPWPACLWHASLAAYVTCLLMRWWGTAWVNNLKRSLQDKQAAAEAAEEEAASANKAIKT